MTQTNRKHYCQWLVMLLLVLGCYVTGFATSGPLPANKAFRLTQVHIKNNMLITAWQVLPEYYLYKKFFQFTILNTDDITLGQPRFPTTTINKYYPTGEKIPVFTGTFTITLPLFVKKPLAGNQLTLKVAYQGCSELGVCYPPQQRNLIVHITSKQLQPTTPPLANPSEQGKILTLLHKRQLFMVIAAFWFFGLLLSLTPCVLPMIPILSGIIIGQKHITHVRSFGLSAVYVLAMALTYAALGLVVGLVGSSVQAIFQQPWIIVLFSLIFVAMALSLFGFFNLQLPAGLRTRMANISNHQRHGGYFGAAIMGCLSTLILSPCVTPPLASAIIYIGDQGDAVLGAIALFSLGIGMGIPLLIVGASSAKLLPRAGGWMNRIKYALGFVMLGVAIWTLARIIPGQISMFLWAALAIGVAIFFRTFTHTRTTAQWIGKIIGIAAFIYGILLVIAASQNYTNPLQPLAFTQHRNTPQNTLQFKHVITSLPELQHILAQTKRPVMLDFYATWCADCQAMDAYTFTDPTVKALLNTYTLVRADVTMNSKQNQLLEKQYKVIAPPTLLFFNAKGQEIPNARIVGLINAAQLIKHLKLFSTT